MLSPSYGSPDARIIDWGAFASADRHQSIHGQRLSAETPLRNDLLAALPREAFAELRPRLERVPLSRKQILHERHVPLRYAYFIEDGAASVLSKTDDRGFAEVATLGRGDLVGVCLALGLTRSPHRCLVQVPGEALRIGAEELSRALEALPALRKLLLAYVQAAMVQSAQLAVCNTRHSLRERLARWLLLAHDRLDGDEIPLTHQSLSRAIGVRRAGVTTAMGRMEEAGIVRRGRGRLVILDRAALEAASCRCYGTIKAEHRRIFCSSEPDLPLGEPGGRRDACVA
ncbi:MAG TPA: Crp/Fnr family transcriptional regulator [Mesorhizobium sp.]|jgi:CRP-like cAMP-binding protein|nr:Crp/Fnr family transcriptional regulator [Mesorhizobium sp.]